MIWLLCLCFSGFMTVGGILSYVLEAESGMSGDSRSFYHIRYYLYESNIRNAKTGKTAAKKRARKVRQK